MFKAAMAARKRFDESEIAPSNLIIGKSYYILSRETNRDSQRGIGHRFKGLNDNKATFKRIEALSGVGIPIMDDSVKTSSYKFYDINNPYLKDRESMEYESSSSTDPLPPPLPHEERAKSRRSSSDRAKSRRSSSSSSGTRRSSSIKNPTVMDIARFRDGEAITFTRDLLDQAQFFDMIRRDRSGQYVEDLDYPAERGIKYIFHKPR